MSVKAQFKKNIANFELTFHVHIISEKDIKKTFDLLIDSFEHTCTMCCIRAVFETQ